MILNSHDNNCLDVTCPPAEFFEEEAEHSPEISDFKKNKVPEGGYEQTNPEKVANTNEKVIGSLPEGMKNAFSALRGDPHCISLKGERFDIFAKGMVQMIRIPRSTAVDSKLQIDVHLMSNIHRPCAATWADSVKIQGTLLNGSVAKVSIGNRMPVVLTSNALNMFTEN